MGYRLHARGPAGKWCRVASAVAGAFLFLQAGAASGAAQSAEKPDVGMVSVELNRLEPQQGACQAYLVIGNDTAIGFESLALDLVMFDPQGVVSRRLAVELAPLPAGKTSVRVFSLAETSCEAIGRVLLNAIVSCRDASGERKDCLDLVDTSSRAPASFIE